MASIQTKQQRGVSLIEVLVALLVMGVGIMGFVALQLRAVDTTSTTYSRTQAMAIARDVIERVNTNHEAWPDGYDESGNKWSSPLAGNPASCVRPQGAASTVVCDEAEMAEADVDEVKSVLDTMLFQGAISVEQKCAGTEVACVIVAWDGTTIDDCDPDSVTIGGNNDDANCVIVEFWPQRTVVGGA